MSDVVDKALALREGLKAWLEKDRYLHDDDPTKNPSLRKAFRDNWDKRVGGEKFGGVWSIGKAKSNGDHPASEEANKIKTDWSGRTVTVDHAIPVNVLFGLFWRAETPGDMEKVTDAYWVAVITKDENARLNKAGLKQKMPEGWHFGDDPRARWNEVNIGVPDVQQTQAATAIGRPVTAGDIMGRTYNVTEMSKAAAKIWAEEELGMVKVDKCTAGFDGILPDGRKLQVKSKKANAHSDARTYVELSKSTLEQADDLLIVFVDYATCEVTRTIGPVPVGELSDRKGRYYVSDIPVHLSD